MRSVICMQTFEGRDGGIVVKTHHQVAQSSDKTLIESKIRGVLSAKKTIGDIQKRRSYAGNNC